MITRITSILAASVDSLSWCRRAFVVSLMLILCPVSLVAGTGAKSEIAGIRVEVVSEIPASYIWHSRAHQVLRDSQGTVVAFWPLDEEAAIEKEGRKLLGVAMVGLGDLAEFPVAFLVWGHKGEVFSDEMTSRYMVRNEKVVLFFLPPSCSGILECRDTVVALPIRISSDGVSVYVRGNLIGKIRSEGDKEN